MPEFKRDESELGVLWKKTSGRGDFMTGTLEIDGVKQPIVVFPNGNKKSDKSPDFRILKARPRQQPQDDDSAPF